jgi:hypothetical protein
VISTSLVCPPLYIEFDFCRFRFVLFPEDSESVERELGAWRALHVDHADQLSLDWLLELDVLVAEVGSVLRFVDDDCPLLVAVRDLYAVLMVRLNTVSQLENSWTL